MYSPTHFLGPFVKLQHVSVSTVIYVCPSARRNSSPTGRIFIKFGILFLKIFQDSSRLIKIWDNKFKFAWSFMAISRLIILQMRNVSDKLVQNEHILYSVTFSNIGL